MTSLCPAKVNGRFTGQIAAKLEEAHERSVQAQFSSNISIAKTYINIDHNEDGINYRIHYRYSIHSD